MFITSSTWSNQTISVPSTLQSLTGDVTITENGLTDNTHVLSWSHTNSQWEAKNLALSHLPNTIVNTGSGTNGLNAGVSTSSLALGNVLYYNGTNWINQIPSAGSSTIQGCSDVSITESGLSGTNNILYFDANTGQKVWKAKTLTLGDLPSTVINSSNGTNGLNAGVSTSSLVSGNVLTYDGTNWINSTPSIPSTLQALTGDVNITESGLVGLIELIELTLLPKSVVKLVILLSAREGISELVRVFAFHFDELLSQ